MRYVAWDARLSKRDDKGVAAREHLRAAARRGSAYAIEQLDGPPFPEALRCLWDWHLDLRQGIGAGLDGTGELTWVVVDAWARMKEQHPAPHEVSALFALDAIARNPDALEA